MKKQCKYCKEMIQVGAVVCPYCQSKKPLGIRDGYLEEISLEEKQRIKDERLEKLWRRTDKEGISFEEFKRKREHIMEERKNISNILK